MIFLSKFINLKSKYIIKGAIAQIERKQGKLTFESNSSENSNSHTQK